MFRYADDDRRAPSKHTRRPIKRSGATPKAATINWADEAQQLARQLTNDRLDELATSLGVTVDALKAVGVGWATADDLRRYGASGAKWKQNPPDGAFAFPERDGNGRITGVSLRTVDGRKSAPSKDRTGARRGLIIPATWKDRPGPVLVVEGASDVAACEALQLRAIGRPSNTGGADDLAELLAGIDAILIGENDKKADGSWPGRDGAKLASAKLATAWGKSVAWALPSEDAKDIRAHLSQLVDSGLDLSDADACKQAGAELLATLQANAKAERPETLRDFRIVADVETKPVRWLWWHRIAIGKLSMIAGDPGLGKSFLTLDLAARVSAGRDFPDGSPCERGGVVVISCEDDLADTIRPRLEAARADLKRIAHIPAVDLADIPTLESAIRFMPDCRLVVIDPISAFTGNTDSHKNAEVRSLLAPLSEVASKHEVAIVAVTHLRKGEGSALQRLMGSIAFVAAARAAFGVTKDANDPSGLHRLFLPIKNNLGNDKTGLRYHLAADDSAIPVVAWSADPVTISIDDAMAPPKRSAKTDEAADWLENRLSDGKQHPARQLEDDGAKAGFSKKVLRSARERLNVKSVKSHFDGGWLWQLPSEDAQDAQNPIPGNRASWEAEGILGDSENDDAA